MHAQACWAGNLQIDFLGFGRLLSEQATFVRSSCCGKSVLTSKLSYMFNLLHVTTVWDSSKRDSVSLTNLWSLAMFLVTSTAQAGQVPVLAMCFVRRLARVSLAVLKPPCVLKSTNFFNRKSGYKLERGKKNQCKYNL